MTPEMNPDPVFDKLAKFTPDAARANAAELLFAAGRASARAHWGWKAAVVGLVLANVVSLGFLVFRTSEPLAPVASPATVAPTTPPTQPTLKPPKSSADDPWSYRSLISIGDPDEFPVATPVTGPSQPAPVLSVLSARRGELD
jgi:hypothetical protein